MFLDVWVGVTQHLPGSTCVSRSTVKVKVSRLRCAYSGGVKEVPKDNLSPRALVAVVHDLYRQRYACMIYLRSVFPP